MEFSIPTPPVEDTMKHSVQQARRNTASSSKSSKSSSSTHRVTKRASPQNSSRSPAHDHGSLSPHSGSLDSRHKRVWKACERCRMKKTKCDGEFPCKRCKDDGLVCTAGTRKKTEYKQLPRGYAEVLEHTQFALVATVHKLYSMVRSGQQWDLGEPDLNDRGQPIIHNIATKLGCIRPNADADLPPHSVFPEDEPGMAQLAAELEIQQLERDRERALEDQQQQLQQPISAHQNQQFSGPETEDSMSPNHSDPSSVSELDHSESEDYRKAFLNTQDLRSLSPQSLKQPFPEFEHTRHPNSSLMNESLFPALSPPSQPQQLQQHQANSPPSYTTAGTTAAATAWTTSAAPRSSIPQQQQYMAQQPMDVVMADLMLSQGLMESEFGTIKPHVLCGPNSDAMLGLGDPMIFSGYPGMESLRS